MPIPHIDLSSRYIKPSYCLGYLLKVLCGSPDSNHTLKIICVNSSELRSSTPEQLSKL